MESGKVAALLLALCLPLAIAGCSDDATPTPTPSPGAGSDSGVTDSGSSPDTGTSSDAGADTGTPEGGAGAKEFGDACQSDTECKSNVCFKGGNQSYCSFRCTMANAATACPAPPTTGQCNNQGFCRKP
jgi:hypothetical protein